MIALIRAVMPLSAVPIAVCIFIFLNNRARRRRLIALVEKEKWKTEIWAESMKNQMRLFQDSMRLLEERRAKNVTPDPEPQNTHKPAGKKEFTVQNVVNLLERSGLHVEYVDEIYPAVDPFTFAFREAPEPEKEREIHAIRLTVSPKGRFIRARKIRRRPR
jgi:hypothetical protein